MFRQSGGSDQAEKASGHGKWFGRTDWLECTTLFEGFTKGKWIKKVIKETIKCSL
jgi:hypothetical protein